MESASPSVFTDNNKNGVERVRRSKHKYAFLTETPTILYETNKHCELAEIGHQLDSKYYGIAVPTG